ncbi:hypothetical protein P886_1214 [Alteromonadaceae bacterium 2753L.S.0a.02]|nr:hypothetical protein P886_1214 [Alteromonadaceae bacterium 2753L.S.0a.02]
MCLGRGSALFAAVASDDIRVTGETGQNEVRLQSHHKDLPHLNAAVYQSGTYTPHNPHLSQKLECFSRVDTFIGSSVSHMAMHGIARTEHAYPVPAVNRGIYV